MEPDIEERKIELGKETIKHLNTARKWTMFLSIAGFIFLGLVILVGLIASTFLSTFSTGGTIPDMTLFIDIEVDEIARRQLRASQSADRMESAGREFYERVRQGFRAIANNEPKRFTIINGMNSAESIHTEIWNIFQQRFLS